MFIFLLGLKPLPVTLLLPLCTLLLFCHYPALSPPQPETMLVMEFHQQFASEPNEKHPQADDFQLGPEL